MRTFLGRRLLLVLLGLIASGQAAQAQNVPVMSVSAMLMDRQALAGAHDIELQGNFAFVAGKHGALAVVDVADPTQPKIVWSKFDPKQFDESETVLPMGDWLLLGTRDMLLWDIRDPRRPVFQQTIADRPQINVINGMARHGSRVVAANKKGPLVAFDVSKSGEVSLIGSLDIHARDKFESPHDLDIRGDLLVMVDPARFGRGDEQGQLGVYRLVDPQSGKTLPPEQWPLIGRVAGHELVGANRVKLSGQFAYAACSISPSAKSRTEAQPGTDRKPHVTIVELTDPTRPKIVGAMEFPDVRGPNGLTVAGQVVFAAGGQTVLAVDVSDPRQPLPLASCKVFEAMPVSGPQDDGHDLVYRDGYLYVTGQVTNGLAVVRINTEGIRKLAETLPAQKTTLGSKD